MYDVIDFTNYTLDIKPLKTLNNTNYITGRNFKLTPNIKLTEKEIEIAKEVLMHLIHNI